MRPTIGQKIESIATYAVVIFGLLFFLFPVYWIFSMSLKTRLQVFTVPPVWIFTPTLGNYEYALTGTSGLEFMGLTMHGMIGPMINSLIIGLGSTAISLVVGTLAAFSFARFRFKGSKSLAVWMLSTRMGPPVAIAFPMFYIAIFYGLVDTHLMMILAHVTLQLPFAIWVMRGFMIDVPIELEESAMVDGCTRLSAFRRILVPVIAPGLATVAIFSFIFSWTDLIFAIILTRDAARTAPLAAIAFVEQKGILWGPLSASAVMMTVPLLVFAFFVQKYIVRGLTFGAVKG